MSWIANIIADASYEEELFIGGYAGGICLLSTENEQLQLTELSPGVMPDAPNPNVVEMRAVTTMLHRLSRMLQANAVEISKLNIYTDSRTLINEYAAYQQGGGQEKYLEHLQLLEKTLGKINIPANAVTFHKVKAHVPDQEASPIERLHNLIDKNAKTARFMLQNHYFKPDLSKNKQFYAALIHPSMTDAQFSALITAGFTLAQRGMKARVYAGNHQEVQDTPLVIGIRLFAAQSGVEPLSLYEPVYGHIDGGLMNGCEGADRAFVRKEMAEQAIYTHHTDFNRSYKINGAVATRLMLGQQFIGHFNSTHLTGRNEPASQFVVDLHAAPGGYERPEQVSHWLHKINGWNQLPLVHDLDGLNQRIGHEPVPEALVARASHIAQEAATLLRDMQEFMSGRPLTISLHEVLSAQFHDFTLNESQLDVNIKSAGTSSVRFKSSVQASLLEQVCAPYLTPKSPQLSVVPVHDHEPTADQPRLRAALRR